jgi:hypothetical protein
MFFLFNYRPTVKTLHGTLKIINTDKKAAWFIYMPGPAPKDAYWAFGKGKTVDGNLLKFFTTEAQTAKVKVYRGKLVRVTLEGQVKRVFAPMGKVPPVAKILMDVLFLAGKSGTGKLFPRDPNTIFFDPKTMTNEVEEDQSVDDSTTVEEEVGEEVEEEDDVGVADLALVAQIVQQSKEAESIYYVILKAAESGESIDDELITISDKAMTKIMALSENKNLKDKKNLALEEILSEITQLLVCLSDVAAPLAKTNHQPPVTKDTLPDASKRPSRYGDTEANQDAGVPKVASKVPDAEQDERIQMAYLSVESVLSALKNLPDYGLIEEYGNTLDESIAASCELDPDIAVQVFGQVQEEAEALIGVVERHRELESQNQRLFQDLQDEMASWDTILGILQGDLDEMLAEGPLDADKQAYMDEQFQLLDDRLAETKSKLASALKALGA